MGVIGGTSKSFFFSKIGDSMVKLPGNLLKKEVHKQGISIFEWFWAILAICAHNGPPIVDFQPRAYVLCGRVDAHEQAQV